MSLSFTDEIPHALYDELHIPALNSVIKAAIVKVVFTEEHCKQGAAQIEIGIRDSTQFRFDVDRFRDEIGAIVVFDHFQRLKLIVIEIEFTMLIIEKLGKDIIDLLVSFT